MSTNYEKEYGNVNAIGVLQLTNYGGLEILGMDPENVVACFNFGNGREMIRSHKIIYCGNGRAYFRKMGRRYYFDQIMRV